MPSGDFGRNLPVKDRLADDRERSGLSKIRASGTAFRHGRVRVPPGQGLSLACRS
jgi:hypothetical protein